jgi:hypothetical protein
VPVPPVAPVAAGDRVRPGSIRETFTGRTRSSGAKQKKKREKGGVKRKPSEGLGPRQWPVEKRLRRRVTNGRVRMRDSRSTSEYVSFLVRDISPVGPSCAKITPLPATRGVVVIIVDGYLRDATQPIGRKTERTSPLTRFCTRDARIHACVRFMRTYRRVISLSCPRAGGQESSTYETPFRSAEGNGRARQRQVFPRCPTCPPSSTSVASSEVPLCRVPSFH